MVVGPGARLRQERKYRRTARTRRESLPLEGSPSLSKTLETYFSTGRSVITSLSAIPWFDRPSAISSSTSRSRGVSSAIGSSRRSLREEGRDDDRVERRAAVGDPSDGGDEVVDVADPVLEQVADALGRVGEQLHREAQLDVLREDEHTDRRVSRANLDRRAEPLVGVSRGQADVDDRDVGRVAAQLAQEIVGVPHCAKRRTRLVEEPRDTLAQKNAVLGDRYAHGISALTRVPPPCGVQTRSRPPSASTRSASPRRPVARSLSAPPTPSSAISTRGSPSSRADRDARRARLRMLADVGEALGDDVVGRDLDRLVSRPSSSTCSVLAPAQGRELLKRDR